MAVDLEGVAGYFRWDPADRQREREFITGEANAAIAGAFEGGAAEVLVTEAHGNMRNIIPEKLDRRATFLSGQPKPMNHMAGIDDTFDAAMFVGYHSKAGTRGGVMAHTYRVIIFSLRFNGVEVGELGADAAIAGYYGVPVVLLTGDSAACNEGRELLDDIETVAVKEGVSRYAAKSKPPEEAHRLIQEGARRALSRVKTVRPFTFKPPVTAEVTFIDPFYADSVANLPFVERVDGCTVRFTSGDYLEVIEIFYVLSRVADSYRQ